MRFTQDLSSGLTVIRAHDAGRLQINDAVYSTAIIVSATAVLPAPEVEDAGELGASHALRLLALEPEIVLLGTGARQILPARDFCAPFLTKGIGVEAMNTGAACRTFNVLVSERRQVVALLWP